MLDVMNESQIQECLARAIRLSYPDVIFHSDFGSGVKLTMGQAVKQKRLNGGLRAFPDFQICKACHGYNGMFLELKRDGVRVFKKNGDIVANDHFKEQFKMLEKLRGEGYYAEFAIGLNDALNKVRSYLGKGSDIQEI